MSKIIAFSHRIDSWKIARQVAADLRLWAECDQSHEDPGHVLIARHLLSEMANSLDRALDHMEVQASREYDKKPDELNAVLGGGECEVEKGEGQQAGWWVCKSCGCAFDMIGALACNATRKPRFCPNCGKAVKR